jgi:hypothetical protein
VTPLLDTHSVCTKLSSTHATKCTDTNVGLPHVVQSPFLRNRIRSIPGRFTTECLYRVPSCMTSTTQPCFLDFTTAWQQIWHQHSRNNSIMLRWCQICRLLARKSLLMPTIHTMWHHILLTLSQIWPLLSIHRTSNAKIVARLFLNHGIHHTLRSYELHHSRERLQNHCLVRDNRDGKPKWIRCNTSGHWDLLIFAYLSYRLTQKMATEAEEEEEKGDRYGNERLTLSVPLQWLHRKQDLW